jgi:hypothetical protein
MQPIKIKVVIYMVRKLTKLSGIGQSSNLESNPESKTPRHQKNAPSPRAAPNTPGAWLDEFSRSIFKRHCCFAAGIRWIKHIAMS